MVFNNYGLSGAAVRIGGTGLPPRFGTIGDGSGTRSAAIGSLFSESGASRRDFTGSIDYSTTNIAKWRFDYGSQEMSGIQLSEIGIASGSTAGVQDIWFDDGFASLTFDGTNELVLEIGLRTY